MLVVAALGWGAAVSLAAAQSTTEQVVVNRASGLAIDGYDPVAYFTDGKPLIGREEFEASHDSAIWRFGSAGNRAAFVANPEVYVPQFGGHDPADVGRGVPVRGRPALWAISGQRLFLFSNEAQRADFIASPQRLLDQARSRWPALRDTLAR